MNDLRIELALALAKHKSFSLTEQNIYVSRSIIRKQITALEKELGVLLFIRSKQSIRLTDERKIIIEAFKITKDKQPALFFRYICHLKSLLMAPDANPFISSLSLS